MSGLDAAIARPLQRVAALAIALIASLALASCSDDDGDGSGQAGVVGPEGVATSAVVIRGLAFDPPQVTVTSGNLVQWTNGEVADPAVTAEPDASAPTIEHTVTADDGTTFDSGPLGGGATFTFTFTEPGTYGYHCSIHPSMTGTIEVT